MQKLLWRINLIIAKISGQLKRLGWIHVLKILLHKPLVKPVKFSLITITGERKTSSGMKK